MHSSNTFLALKSSSKDQSGGRPNQMFNIYTEKLPALNNGDARL